MHFVGFEVEQTRISLHFCRRNTAWGQSLPSKVFACPLHQCLFVCHRMFHKIVLGGTILLFATWATFNITSLRQQIVSFIVNLFLAKLGPLKAWIVIGHHGQVGGLGR
jgi:hypothetical protein